ncbi:Hypothetical predicted protein [Cloeon dipterum]|uniref:G-protein coupled receptors family 1 profile domain-containing protein n=1 Tax=Cloeon dipterum TaxID=197152 RepID=A0A8S1DR62_9INSE|nr:Hypothetical predicted protein [Cloeon dipterum]
MSTLFNYGVFAASILLGVVTISVNSVTIFASATKKALDKPSYKFILGLAISDGMMGIFIPANIIYKTFYEQYYVKDTYSKYFYHCFLPIFPVLISFAASNVFQMVIAFDRCISIMNPVLHRNLLTKRFANFAVCAVFAFSAFLCSMPIYWNNFPNNRIFYSCVLLTLSLPYFIYIIVPAFAVNLACLFFTYVQVYRVAAARLSDNAKPLKLVAVILTCQAVCWFPHIVGTYLLLSDDQPKENLNVHNEYNLTIYSIYHCFLLLAMSSSFLNALLYSWRMPDFHTAISVNTITIIAATTRKALDKPSYKFILGLAIADCMVGIFLPANAIYKTFVEEHYVKDTYSKYFCHCFLPIFLVLASCIASNIMQMIIAFDRCVSVMKPVLHQNFLTKRLANRIVCAVFTFSTVVSSMPIYWNNFPDERILNLCTLLTLTYSFHIYVLIPAYAFNLVCLVFIYVQVLRVVAARLTNNAKTMKEIFIELN